MLYSDTINSAPLTDAEARNVRERFDLRHIHTSLCDQTSRAIRAYDLLDQGNILSPDDQTKKGILRGLIHEQTFLLLFSSHATMKIHALPAPYYDDALNSRMIRTDAYLYDNRSIREQPRYAAQIKSKLNGRRYLIPVIQARHMKNDADNPFWNSDKPFQTARNIIMLEQQGAINSITLSKIDQIKGQILKNVFLMVENPYAGIEVRQHVPHMHNPMVRWMRERKDKTS